MAITAIAVLLDVALLFYVVLAYFARNLEPPRALFIAVAHTEFVVMMTNALLATILPGTLAQRERIWPWADQVIFWGVNLGWVGFAVVELIGATGLVRIFTPILGISLLTRLTAQTTRRTVSPRERVQAADYGSPYVQLLRGRSSRRSSSGFSGK